MQRSGLSLITLLLLQLHCLSVSTTSVTEWRQVLDSLGEYSLLNSSFVTKNLLHCLARAAVDQVAADAAIFSTADGTCHLYRCVWGESGCRKCRNSNTTDGVLLWVKPLLHHNRRACWRTFQHRVDGSEVFNRSWSDYQVGFGQGELRNFWLGLDALHEATKDGLRRVRWELNLWSGEPFWAENEHFIVARSDELYRLDIGPLDSDRSTLGMCDHSDARSPFNQSFTTYDRDNDDKPPFNCAQRYGSGWWHGSCFCFNPNGLYFGSAEEAALANQNGKIGMIYFWMPSNFPFAYSYSMQFYECLITEFV